MKIFIHVTSTAIDEFTDNVRLLPTEISYNQAIRNLLSYGSTSMWGAEPDKLEVTYFVTFANSAKLQKKWAQENGFPFPPVSWEVETLARQIETFRPDVIYTLNPSWLSKKFSKLPAVKLKVAWRAAPISKDDDFSEFDLGLSYASVYREMLLKHGVKAVGHMDFSFDPEIKKQFDRLRLQKENDICFVGRYNAMFLKRNQLLEEILKNFQKKYRVAFHLLVARRVKGLIPMLPLRMWSVWRRPVFLNELLEVFVKSRIAFNCHSEVAGKHKGNMRVFEVLGSGSFMLSDAGNYPEHLIDGRDFVGYTDSNDLLNKIDYYLNHDEEREVIAKQGHETLSTYYSTQHASQKLQRIFEKYL